MPHDDPRTDPSTTSSAYDAMLPIWRKIDSLLDGTEAMRAAGETYLPMHEHEEEDAYLDRLNTSVLLNRTALTLDSWVGRPFSDPMNFEDCPPELEELFKDIDLQGSEVGIFAREWFKKGLAKSFSHVLVDFPLTAQAEGRTLADDRDEGLRPYWALIEPENLIFASATVVDGREVLTHIRIRETEVIRDGFAEAAIERIRVFDRFLPGTLLPGMLDEEGGPLPEERQDPDARLVFDEGGVFFSLWRLVRTKGKEEWKLEVHPTRIDIDEIPLITFYSDRQSLMKGKSPLEDLADLNIQHWQSGSDQNNILTVTRFPLLAGTGIDPKLDILEVGPRRMLGSTNENAKFGYVEHTGKAIAAGRQQMLDLDEAMADYGADFLKKRPGNMTATARALDSAEATSPLQDAVIRFNAALERAKRMTGKWIGMEETGTVTVPVDFGPETLVDGDLDALKAARQGRDLSRVNYLEELKRRGALRDEFDFTENARQLEAESAAFDGEPTDGEPIDPFAEE